MNEADLSAGLTLWKVGRAVECSGLKIRRGPPVKTVSRGFESHTFRVIHQTRRGALSGAVGISRTVIRPESTPAGKHFNVLIDTKMFGRVYG